MCRMIAVKNFDFAEHGQLMEEFIGLARTGRLLPGDPPGHGDGWGIGYYRGGQAVLHRSAGSAYAEKERCLALLQEAGRTPVLIFHLRKSAWPATTTIENAHPFLYDNILFAHNGTIRDYKALLPSIKQPQSRPLEQMLDTEVFLLYILSNHTEGGINEVFLRSVLTIKEHNTFSSLNCIFSDGDHLFGYRDFSKYPEYYTLYRAATGRSSFLSSEPLPSVAGWELLGREETITL